MNWNERTFKLVLPCRGALSHDRIGRWGRHSRQGGGGESHRGATKECGRASGVIGIVIGVERVGVYCGGLAILVHLGRSDLLL